MDFRILGPLEALDEGRDVAPAGSKGRALLALLLVHANETLPVERLIDELWGERPPASAAKTVQVHVSRLRKALAAGAGNGVDGVIVTREHGYQLTLDPERLDAHRFERLVAEGRRELGTGDPARATAALESALALWRGAPLADLAYEPFVQREIGRLEDLRVAALEDLNEAKLALGRHGELVGQLEALIGEHPYRERLRAQLMLALYRCERQADALQAYQDARRTLVDELGIEPGERLRELELAILAQDPALAAPAAETGELVASRLPVPPTRTFGRDGDRDAVADLLRREDVRLVTLVGPGGVGKTRLALEVARELEPELPDAAWVASLAAIARAEHVPSAIAQAVRVTPLRGEDPRAAVERCLAPKRGLLVLDNFEHLLVAASLVSDLLAACPALKVLATSRGGLGLQAEHRYTVAPLPVPAQGEPVAVDQAAAGALFVERARRHDRAFELSAANAGAIAEVCRRLDGLPLAIELAAARTMVLGAQELNSRLAEALDVLGSGPRDAPDRQRTLRATIDWSHRLLSVPEAEAFARFAVFAGGATIVAAQEVTDADLDTLEGLVDKQLLMRRHDSGGVRLAMLETVREYARERLEDDGGASQAHERHYRFLLDLAERAAPELFMHGKAEWLRRLEAEIDNFRGALDWALRVREPELALRLAGLLGEYWELRGGVNEGLRWLEDALAAAGEEAPVEDRARARRAQAELLEDEAFLDNTPEKFEAAKQVASEALALSRQAGDPAGIAEALVLLSGFELLGDRSDQRRALADEALHYAREAGENRIVADALTLKALSSPIDEADSDFAQAAALYREVGDVRGLIWLNNNAGYFAILRRGDYSRGQLEETIALAQRIGEPIGLSSAFINLGLYGLFGPDRDCARMGFQGQLRLHGEHGVRLLASESLAGLAALAVRERDPDRASRLLGAASSIGPIRDAQLRTRLEREFFAPARAGQGERRWNEAHAAGARLAFEEAIGLALGERPGRVVRSGVFEPGVSVAGSRAGQALMTFMFTDMVGSTRVLDELGDDAWNELLSRHDTIVREQFVARGGREVKHEGDGFFVAFADATAAVEAGCAIQRALAAHRAEQGALPAVRIGIHRTSATSRGGDFIGRGVHEAARLAAAAGGGEVLVSLQTFESAGERFDGCRPRELELQGIRSPIRVLSVRWES